jgi:hypothetical protein
VVGTLISTVFHNGVRDLRALVEQAAVVLEGELARLGQRSRHQPESGVVGRRPQRAEEQADRRQQPERGHRSMSTYKTLESRRIHRWAVVSSPSWAISASSIVGGLVVLGGDRHHSSVRGSAGC